MLQFSEWLRLQQGLLFNDLTSEQARSHFVGFVEAWNSRGLPARYYRGVAGTTLRRTKHAWAIKGASPLPRQAAKKDVFRLSWAYWESVNMALLWDDWMTFCQPFICLRALLR